MLGFALRLVATMIAVLAASELLAPDYFAVPDLATAVGFGALLGVLNAVVRPVLAVMTFPLHILTFGAFSLVLNAGLLWVAAGLVPGVHVGGVVGTFLAAVVIAIVSALVNRLIR